MSPRTATQLQLGDCLLLNAAQVQRLQGHWRRRVDRLTYRRDSLLGSVLGRAQLSDVHAPPKGRGRGGPRGGSLSLGLGHKQARVRALLIWEPLNALSAQRVRDRTHERVARARRGRSCV